MESGHDFCADPGGRGTLTKFEEFFDFCPAYAFYRLFKDCTGPQKEFFKLPAVGGYGILTALVA